MARMEMRSREAPMEWEREQDRNIPNIFSKPQLADDSAQSATPATSHQQQQKQQTPFHFGGGGGGAQRGSSFASLSSQGSFNNDGWGSTTPKPFCQDSQLLTGNGAAAGVTTPRQDSFSFGQGGGSFSRPQSPNKGTTTSAIRCDGSRTAADAAEIMEVDGDHSFAHIAKTGSEATEPFDMGSLRNGVVVEQGRLSPRRMLGKSRSSTSRHDSSALLGSRTSSMQYRGSGAAGMGKGASFWSDDDNDDEDMNDPEDDGDEDSYGHRSSGRSLGRNMIRNTDTRRRLRDQDNSERRRSDHVRASPAQGRVWTENVDLPYIISGYVQVAMNSAFVAIVIYIIYNFITTIQGDVTIRAEAALRRELQIIANCKRDYKDNNCSPTPVPLLIAACEKLSACINRHIPRIERSAIAAETFALIFNSFVHTISYKTMGFLVVLVFGALYFSNHAISSYRHNHLIHHPHHQDSTPYQAGFISPAPSSDANSMIPAGLKRNGSHHGSGGNGMLLGSSSSSFRQGSLALNKGVGSGNSTLQHRGSRYSDNE
ncbi:hypothetical protein BGZ95_010322 [Linnemannia exigua]|uniref:Brl1/Brr6 domain-containing protein n=1 Tax=Linnemannia exigua TaxID=604196 RepID=A0AAD4H6F5_9FUNG|nr:hypothetical protein BGZ95_010322 [Linnemannia exigua]